MAVEPTEQEGDGPGVVQEPVARTGQDSQLGRAARSIGQLAGVCDRHNLVVGTVNYEQRPGRDLRRQVGRTYLLELACPRRQVWREGPAADDTRGTCLRNEAARSLAPSAKSAGGANAATPATEGSSPAAHIESVPPAAKPTSQTCSIPGTARSCDIAAARSALQPRREKSPPELPVPRKLKVSTTAPVSAARRSASSG